MNSEHREITEIIQEKRFTRREVLAKASLVGVGLVAGPTVLACGAAPTAPTDDSTGESSAPKKGGILRVGIVGGSASDRIDIMQANSEPEIALSFQLGDHLLAWGPDYALEYHLAEEVTPNEDATEWTVRLKPDVMFSDGRPVTADDVIFSYRRIVDPKNPMMGRDALGTLTPNGIVKLDDRTVKFVLETPNAILDEGFAYRSNFVYPADWNPKAPIGAGPFALKAFRPGEQFEFTRNEYYWGEGPYVDELLILEFADEAARVNALISETVDAISQLPPAQISTVTTAGKKVLDTKCGAYQPFTMRIDQKPFDDVLVRKAFRLIPNREEMIQQAYSGFGWIGNDMYAPFDPGTPDLPQRDQDLEQAKSLLKQAGYDGNLTVGLTTSHAVGSGAVAAAQIFAEHAKGAGVKVNVDMVDPSRMFGEDYLRWTFAQTFFYTRNYLANAAVCTIPGPPWAPCNETHWRNERWLKLVHEAYRTVDAVKRNELIGEAQTIEYEEGGYIIWAFNNQVDAYSEKLGGVKPHKAGMPLSSWGFNRFYFE